MAWVGQHEATMFIKGGFMNTVDPYDWPDPLDDSIWHGNDVY
jgi:hypothetical protein